MQKASISSFVLVFKCFNYLNFYLQITINDIINFIDKSLREGNMIIPAQEQPKINWLSITKLYSKFFQIRSHLGVDKAVFYSILLRGCTMSGSLVTLPMIMTRLSPAEQGYYYTFGSILALQTFLELGFGTVAVQMIAHASGKLKIDITYGISGEKGDLDQFSASLRFIQKWYRILSILVGVLLLPIGGSFFALARGNETIHWFWPWVILVVVTSGDLFVRSLDSTIEGMGFVAESIRVNIWGAIIRIILSIVGLQLGMRLYAVPTASAVAFIVNRWMIYKLLRVIKKDSLGYGKEIHINWKKDVFPFQWRIALSYASGWLILSAMMPVVFKSFGSIEAGKFGLAMTLCNFVNSIAISWTSTKSAIWGQMASTKNWKAMDKLFYRVTPQAVLMALVFSIMMIAVIPHLGVLMPRFLGRVPDWEILCMLCSVTVLNQIVFAEAFYLRAHRREPFLYTSVAGAIMMSIALFCFSYGSIYALSLMYVGLNLVGVFAGTIIFVICRKNLHLENAI